GRDSAASFNRRWARTPELTMYRWKNVVREGRTQGLALGPDRYLEVLYEGLTHDPEAGMRRICRFIGEAFDEAVLASSEPYLQSTSPEEDPQVPGGRLRPNSGNWQARFSGRTARRLERIGGATLAEFGYHTSAPDSDDD